jgi:septal ring factor EnvC (AmiA/AmiB activator)
MTQTHALSYHEVQTPYIFPISISFWLSQRFLTLTVQSEADPKTVIPPKTSACQCLKLAVDLLLAKVDTNKQAVTEQDINMVKKVLDELLKAQKLEARVRRMERDSRNLEKEIRQTFDGKQGSPNALC